MRGFVLPGYLSDALVPSCEEDDKHKGEEEGNGAGDAPLAEYDAEVLRGPCEDHLVEGKQEIVSEEANGREVLPSVLTFMLHWPMSISPWPISP